MGEAAPGAAQHETTRTKSSLKVRERIVTRHSVTHSAEDGGVASKSEQISDWDGVISLIATTTAPLACRVKQPPSWHRFANESSNPLQPSDQEGALLEDLTYVFMGYEGQHAHFVEDYRNDDERHRFQGPQYVLPPSLTPSLADLTQGLLKTASQYKAVTAFVEAAAQAESGAVSHALCASMSRHLKDFLSLVVQLEHQTITNSTFTLHQLHLHTISTSQTISQLYILVQAILSKTAGLNEDFDGEDFDDVENILEQMREGGDLMPGSMTKKTFKGGNILALLTDRLALMAGNPVAKDLLLSLLRDASAPYTRMLNDWLHHGVIKDAHGEFLIKEQRSIRHERLEEDFTDEYWEKRYTLRDDGVPPQLEAIKSKILLAGKYLNVVRECGGVDLDQDARELPSTFDDPAFIENINGAYARANSALIDLLLTKHALAARLRSMKHYFFLDRSDFFTYFLDLSASELRKPWRSVSTGKLQSLLDLVLRQPGTVAAQDAFKEDIKVHMSSISWTRLVSRILHVKGLEEGEETVENPMSNSHGKTVEDDDAKMTGFEALDFKFSVPFPLSLVISSKTIFRYQILFRYLLSLRHLEDQLVHSWQDHVKILSWIHRSKADKLEYWKRKAWTLRARMLIFVQQTIYYCTAEVIEPNWQTLMSRVEQTDVRDQFGKLEKSQPARTVDELMDHHVDFLDTCLKECMLMNYKLLKIQGKLFTACNLFATYTNSLSRTLFTLAESQTPPLLGGQAHQEFLKQTYGTRPVPHEHTQTAVSSKLDDLYEMLGKYEHNFEHHLRLLLDALDYYAATETVALGRLCAVLGTAMGGREER